MSANTVLQKLISIDSALENNTMLQSELIEAEVDLENLEHEIVELLEGIQALREHVEKLLHRGSGPMIVH
jgi:predicted  nucleic acid-binding Zn-ribbon protein